MTTNKQIIAALHAGGVIIERLDDSYAPYKLLAPDSGREQRIAEKQLRKIERSTYLTIKKDKRKIQPGFPWDDYTVTVYYILDGAAKKYFAGHLL